MNEIIDRHESVVRGYCRSFTTTFVKAKGAWLSDVEGHKYLDFFAGAGALNYGHNPDLLKDKLLEHIQGDGITHSLDMYTQAKEHFLERFYRTILEPRGMDYKVQFPGPTGTNAVEAAMKLARKISGRTNMVFFTNAFHGMTLGALAVTGNEGKRNSAAQPLQNAHFMPFDGYLGEGVDTLDYLEKVLDDRSSGMDMPAGVIVETVQAEGGVNVASPAWLKRLGNICRDRGILLIIDDIQVGCGRTGPFFSFEEAGLSPDMILLSKSLSGYGLPMAVVLIKPEHDIWSPGEHNGTFRGHNLAFVTAAAAMDYWQDDSLSQEVVQKGRLVAERFEKIAGEHAVLKAAVRGRGFILGLASTMPDFGSKVSAACFRRGLIIEAAGVNDQVLKFLAPLNIGDEDLEAGLAIIEEACAEVAKSLRMQAG